MILEGGSLKTGARLERPVFCAKGSWYFCSALMLSFCMTVCWLQTAQTDDVPNFVFSSQYFRSLWVIMFNDSYLEETTCLHHVSNILKITFYLDMLMRWRKCILSSGWAKKPRKPHPKITGTLIQVTLEPDSSRHRRCHTSMRIKTLWTVSLVFLFTRIEYWYPQEKSCVVVRTLYKFIYCLIDCCYQLNDTGSYFHSLLLLSICSHVCVFIY